MDTMIGGRMKRGEQDVKGHTLMVAYRDKLYANELWKDGEAAWKVC